MPTSTNHLTPYHAKYFAHELTRRWPSDSVEKFAAALVDASVATGAAGASAAGVGVLGTAALRVSRSVSIETFMPLRVDKVIF